MFLLHRLLCVEFSCILFITVETGAACFDFSFFFQVGDELTVPLLTTNRFRKVDCSDIEQLVSRSQLLMSAPSAGSLCITEIKGAVPGSKDCTGATVSG